MVTAALTFLLGLIELARIFYGESGKGTVWAAVLCLATSGVVFVTVTYNYGPPFVASFWRSGRDDAGPRRP